MRNGIIFRCPQSLKDRAAEIAAQRDENLSQILRRALRQYVARGQRTERRVATAENGTVGVGAE